MAVAKHTYAFEEKVQVRDVPFRYGSGYDLNVQNPKKKTKKLEDVMPTGIDDGKGARKLLNSYVDEACSHAPRKSHAMINFDILSDDFKSKPFLEQMTHVQMKSIPLLSQIARQDALMPYNNTKKKKHYIDFSKRLKKNDTTLIRARLSSEAIDDSIIKILEVSLQKNTILQHLALHKNAITDEGIEMLCMALRWHPTLHTLWLGANPFTDIGARHLSLLLNRNRTIKELNISNRWPSEIWAKSEYELHPHVTYVGAQYIARQLQRGSGLTSLSLAEQRVRDDGAIYLFEALKHCNLRVLNLRGNELSDRCCVELRTCLQGNPIMEQLILSHNRIGNEGAINIAYGLASNNVLHVLDLGYNAMESAGLDALFLCLKYNTTLTALITVRNKHPDSRAEATVCARVNSVFGFSSFASANAAANKLRNGIGSAGSVCSANSADSRDSSPSRSVFGNRRQSSANGTTLTLDLNVNSGVEIMGRSVHSRSFRSVTIDSKEASRSSSMRGNSFRALSQKSAMSCSDAGQSDTEDERSADDHENVAVPPMLGSAKNGEQSAAQRARTPPAPMLGSNKIIRSPPPQQQLQQSECEGTASALTMTSPLLTSATATTVTTAASATDTASGAESKIGTTTDCSPRRASTPVESPKLKGKAVLITTTDGSKDVTSTATAPTASAAESTSAPPVKSTQRAGSKKFFRKKTTTEEVRQLPDLLKKAPPSIVNIGRPIRSRDVGKTISIPNIRNMGVRPIRTSISPQKDSAQHLMYLRIATPFDPPDERPYPILYVGKDHEAEVKRVRKARQDPQYQFVSTFYFPFLAL